MNPEALLLQDRHQAGLLLADKLADWRNRPDAEVLALPRGGVPVAAAVAQVLRLPLDVLVVRKLGLPFYEEFAIGALASGGQRVLASDTLGAEHLTPQQLDQVMQRELAEIDRRERHYRVDRAPLDLAGKHVILIDDGMATGHTMQAAIGAARARLAATVIVAVPMLSDLAYVKVRDRADGLVYLLMPEHFYSVGQWYEDFGQTSDEEVMDLLAQSGQWSDVHNKVNQLLDAYHAQC